MEGEFKSGLTCWVSFRLKEAVGGLILAFFRHLNKQLYKKNGVVMVEWDNVTAAGVTDRVVLDLTGAPFVMLSLPRAVFFF